MLSIGAFFFVSRQVSLAVQTFDEASDARQTLS